MPEETPVRLIVLAIIAALGLLVTIIINWDKMSANLKRFKIFVCKTDSDKHASLICCLKDYLIHYGYDFDNGKGRDFFLCVDVLTDIESVKVIEWISENYDEATNSLLAEGYVEERETPLGTGFKLNAKGRHYYTSQVKGKIKESIMKIEKELSS